MIACDKIEDGYEEYFPIFTGIIVYEYELKIGWGKAVSLPSQALPAPPPGHMAIRSKEVWDVLCAALRVSFLTIYFIL